MNKPYLSQKAIEYRARETAVFEALKNEPHLEDGKLVYERYDALMAEMRAARAGLAAEVNQ